MKFHNSYIDCAGDVHLERGGYHIIISQDCMVELWSIPMYTESDRSETRYFNNVADAVHSAEGWT